MEDHWFLRRLRKASVAARRSAPAFAQDEIASTALTLAIALPILMGGVAIAVDYSQIVSVHTAMQSAADAAAMSGAKQLVVANMTDSDVISSTRAMALSVVLPTITNAGGDQPSIDVQIGNSRTSVAVTVSTTLHNKLSSVVGVASEHMASQATASLKGRTQLCVLTLDSSSNGSFMLDKTAQITAPQCSAYANSSKPNGLQSTGSAMLTSSRTCTVGGYKGNGANYAPMPITGCPTHSDPLAGIVPPTSASCAGQQPATYSAGTALNPGIFCGGVQLKAGSFTLNPGVYTIDGGDFHIAGSASIQGTGVAIYFRGNNGTFKADPQTSISLKAPTTGSLAGILLYEDGTAPKNRDFHISSVTANLLEGTIYLPQGALTVDSSGKVADQSNYTVIVANQLYVSGGANLTLNSMYSASDVPVPSGVGPTGGNVALTQ